MAHERAQIRARVVAFLNNATNAQCRVFRGRISPARRKELPYIVVSTPSDDVDVSESRLRNPREYLRALTVIVEAHAEERGGVGIDDILDDLAYQIEVALADPFWSDETENAVEVEDAILAATDIEFDDEATRKLGRVKLTYSASYKTLRPVPPSDDSLDDFERFQSTYNLGNEVDPGDEAIDEVEIP
jgi:hypothetical protein